MKKQIPKEPYAADVKSWMVEEAAEELVQERAEISVRTAKDQLSSLLERAARGEDIVITSDGKPKAMIVRYRPLITGKPARSRKELRATMAVGPDSTAKIRAERDAGY